MNVNGVVLLLVACACALPAAEGDLKPDPKPLEIGANPDIADVVKMVSDLGSPDNAVRETAAKALTKGLDEQIKKSPKEYMKALAGELNGADAGPREAASKTLGTLFGDLKKANDKLYAEMIEKINAPEPKDREMVRGKLVGLLNTVIEANVIDKLVEDLASPDAAVTAAAAKKLKDFGADSANALVNALDDERAAVKKGAAEVLKAMGPAAKEVASDLAFLLDNDDKGTRRLAASVLENLGPDAEDAIDDLVGYLDNDEKVVRRLAAGVLKKIGPAVKSATSDLVDLLTNDDKNVRNLAADILLGLGKDAKEGAEALVDIIADENNEPDSRERAAQILGSIGPGAKDVLEKLKKHTEEENSGVKEAVAEAIKKIEAK